MMKFPIYVPVVFVDCVAPMVFFKCSNYEPGKKGTECQRTCQNQDLNNCVSLDWESIPDISKKKVYMVLIATHGFVKTEH